MNAGTAAAVVQRFGIGTPAPDLDGLRTVYAAWCEAVPFDNVLKLIHCAEGRRGPLPGSTADAFFETWLEQGTGGTCWAGNGALHDLLEALGFDVTRVFATMMSAPDARGPNHGSVLVRAGRERWLVDASILTGVPLRLPGSGEVLGRGRLPRFEWIDDAPAVIWRTLGAPEGFPCRIDRIGGDAAEWDTLHQRTVGWSQFNYQLSVRVLRGESSIGVASGQRFAFAGDGSVTSSTLDADGRIRFLVDELGIPEELARRVPPDRPVPPRPASE